MIRLHLLLFLLFAHLFTGAALSRETIQLSLDTAVDNAMGNSYRFKLMAMEIDREIYRLQAHRAGLKTKVFMNLQSPDLKRVSDYKWNSSLQRDQIVRQNTRMWQGDLSVQQPVITDTDRKFDLLIGNLILLGAKKPRKSSSVKRLIPHFQNAKPYPAPSPLLTCRKISQLESENQGKLQKSM